MVQPQENHRPPLRSVMEPYVSVTGATYAAKAGDRLIGVNRAGAVTVTLPTAQLRAGRIYTVKDESGAAATNNITVATEGSETIDGSATDVISDNYGAKHYYSDGSNWFEVPLLPAAAVAHSATTGQGTDDHHAQTHATAHVSGGADSVKLDDLSAPDDNTDLDFSITAHGLVPKGTNAGDFLKDDGSWATPGGGAITREGGQTTEATTTSTSPVELLSATSLTISATSPFMFFVDGRKTSGAADDAGLGYKINATVIAEAKADSGKPYSASTANRAESGGAIVFCGSRVTNYLGGGHGVRSNYLPGGGNQASSVIDHMNTTADMPNAEITSIIMRAVTDNASQAIGADELQAYEYATS